MTTSAAVGTKEPVTTQQVMNLEFRFQQETKGAVRYGELLPSGQVAIAPNDLGAIVGTLYIRKTALGSKTIPSVVHMQLSL